MAENSKIEWCDHSWNPWVGCTKISPACDHCYAEGWAKRTGGAALWQGERRRTSVQNWRQPLKWDRAAASAGVRAKVFCASLADVFDNQVPQEWRTDLWALIRSTPHLDWLLLTKRPQNIEKFVPFDWPDTGYQNVWLGTTVENQQEADRRIPHLLSVPARVHFLSCEPLLGPLDIAQYLEPDEIHGIDWSRPTGQKVGACIGFRPAVQWVIAGGESGPGARPMHPDWAGTLRDQCAAAGVAFHFKQWGEWVAEIQSPEDVVLPGWSREFWKGGPSMWKTGKKAAGRLLDGVEHNGMPEVRNG